MEDMELMEEETQVGFDELNLEDVVAGGLLDFDGWIALISRVEKTYPDNIEKISLVYDSFLSEFPLCYGYWRNYANHKAHLCTVDKAIKVFEQAVQSATYSVGIWFEYCAFGVLAYDDPQDVRRLFNRGLSFVGKDYLCHTLWDRYVEFEYSQQNWSSLAYIYLQCLKWPTNKLQLYYDRFKKLAATWEKELECQTKSCSEEQPVTLLDCEITACRKDDEIFSIIKDLLGSSENLTRSKALQKYISTGEELYQGARELSEKIHGFEMHIRRPYFHVKPLDAYQLENWHHYLDFVEMHGDFDWAVKVYERCLIACANYPEYWMRYVEFMETKGGREIANFALDRATKVFLKRLPAIHHFNARYKEQIGDIASARAALLKCDADSDSVFVDKVIKQANMEKRLGNFVAAANIYKEALKSATKKKKKKKSHALPTVYINYSRLKYMITGSAEAGRHILINGIKQFPHSKLLLEELINFTMLHGGSTHINMVDSIICKAIAQKPDDYQGLSSRDREDISNLYLELIDFCGTIHDIRKAWIRHRNLFPCSLRTTPASTEPLIKVFGKIQDIPASMPQYLLESSKSDHRSQQLLLTNQEPPLPENHHIQAVQVYNDQLQPRKDNVNASERLQQEYPIGLEPSAEHAHEPCTTVGIQEKVLETSNMHDDHDLGIRMDPKQISLENLSLNINDSPVLIPETVNGCEPEVQHQESSLQPHRQAEMISQGDVGQSMYQESFESQQGVQEQCQPEAVITHGISSTTPPRPLQTVKQQGGASPSQFQRPVQPVPHSSEYMSQYPMQTFDQSGNMQNSQAYYQMWQYYYYQQQQQGLFQQQQYYQQQQPPYPQEQLQQQYQQQLQMQQQYPQQLPPYQQHTQFLQQQQQLQQQSYQQQQLQPQTQQQPPYQAQQVPQQQANQQIPQLPDPQLLQQLLQQQQWKQQQLEIHGKQQEKEQSQNHQQFQALTPPEGTSSADAGSSPPRELSPHTQ